MQREDRVDLTPLRDLVRRLRAPDGCPWDREQQLADVRAYLIEEAHEAGAAVDMAVTNGGFDALEEELGDLLFQVVFIAELAREAGAFDLPAVIAGVNAKMVERHPHVFGDGERLADSDAVRRRWEARKAAAAGDASLLAGVPASLPALVASLRLAQKAAGVGFDWPDATGALDKTREELAELEGAMARAATEDGEGRSATREELGDLLFAVANVARKVGVDPEAALAEANTKFRRRFAAVETTLRDRGIALADADLETMEAAWQAVKRGEPAA